MKHIYSILAFCFFLIAGTSCEDDYRAMVLFEGVEPIYQVGTCDNLVSSVTLYLSNSDGIVLGIDGGDGKYSLDGADAAVASVAFSDDINGYHRIKVLPKGEGVTNILVRDSNGASTILKVTVEDSYKFYYYVRGTALMCKGEIDDELWSRVQADLNSVLTVKAGGTYTLMPADLESPYWGGGRLRVHASALVEGFVDGTYEMAEGEGGRAVVRFRYNGEVHDFTTFNPFGKPETRVEQAVRVDQYEDVTSLVTETLPEGCRIYRVERWEYLSEPLMADE